MVPALLRMRPECPKDRPRLAPGFLRMAQDGPMIAEDVSRMYQGFHQDALRMAPGLLRIAHDGPRSI